MTAGISRVCERVCLSIRLSPSLSLLSLSLPLPPFSPSPPSLPPSLPLSLPRRREGVSAGVRLHISSSFSHSLVQLPCTASVSIVGTGREGGQGNEGWARASKRRRVGVALRCIGHGQRAMSGNWLCVEGMDA